AGVLRDSFLRNKTPRELEEVFAPKVAGLVALDEATKNVALDCFIVFASLVGVLGNVAQADYAAANAFMDAYAAKRDEWVQQGKRSGRTLSVNWPLWSEGGMQMDAATRERWWRSAGLVPLQTPAGVTALHQALALDAPQVAVLAGDAAKIKRTLLAAPAPKAKTPPAMPPQADLQKLQAKVEAALMREVAKLLKIDLQNLDSETDLHEFGFDSMSLTEFGNALNERYGLQLTP